MDAIKLQRRRDRRAKLKNQEKVKREKAQPRIKSILIRIDWKRYNPHATATVLFKDGSSTQRAGYRAGGWGYDKESTVIAAIFNDFLRYKIHRKRNGETPYGLYNRENMPGRGMVSYNGGVGTSCYYKIADYIGGRFENVESGKKYDIFKYTDKRAAGRKLPAAADPFGGLKGLMAMGSILADTPEQKNKNRKVALMTQPGISFPENWDSLPEEEKTRRLAGLEECIK